MIVKVVCDYNCEDCPYCIECAMGYIKPIMQDDDVCGNEKKCCDYFHSDKWFDSKSVCGNEGYYESYYASKYRLTKEELEEFFNKCKLTENKDGESLCVTLEMPNGFMILEACYINKQDDYETAYNKCVDNIKMKLAALETYYRTESSYIADCIFDLYDNENDDGYHVGYIGL